VVILSKNQRSVCHHQVVRRWAENISVAFTFYLTASGHKNCCRVTSPEFTINFLPHVSSNNDCVIVVQVRKFLRLLWKTSSEQHHWFLPIVHFLTMLTKKTCAKYKSYYILFVNSMFCFLVRKTLFILREILRERCFLLLSFFAHLQIREKFELLLLIYVSAEYFQLIFPSQWTSHFTSERRFRGNRFPFQWKTECHLNHGWANHMSDIDISRVA